MAALKQTDAIRVFSCCGKYYVTTLKTGTISCKACGKTFKDSDKLKIPKIVICTTK